MGWFEGVADGVLVGESEGRVVGITVVGDEVGVVEGLAVGNIVGIAVVLMIMLF
jgi:hypothetical protein